jgi:hypothetical protein
VACCGAADTLAGMLPRRISEPASTRAGAYRDGGHGSVKGEGVEAFTLPPAPAVE